MWKIIIALIIIAFFVSAYKKYKAEQNAKKIETQQKSIPKHNETNSSKITGQVANQVNRSTQSVKPINKIAHNSSENSRKMREKYYNDIVVHFLYAKHEYYFILDMLEDTYKETKTLLANNQIKLDRNAYNDFVELYFKIKNREKDFIKIYGSGKIEYSDICELIDEDLDDELYVVSYSCDINKVLSFLNKCDSNLPFKAINTIELMLKDLDNHIIDMNEEDENLPIWNLWAEISNDLGKLLSSKLIWKDIKIYKAIYGAMFLIDNMIEEVIKEYF